VSIGGTRVLSLLVSLVLARLLMPADFGLVAIAWLAIDSLQLFRELGFTSALIYRKDRVAEAADTAFYVILVSATLLYLTALIGAPAIAYFFRDPRVTPILRVLSICIVISGLAQVPYVLLAKELDFRRRLLPDLIPAFGDGLVSIGFALAGYGPWSIVYGRLVNAVLTTILVFMVTGWRPRRYFDWGLAKELFGYGKFVVGSQILIFFITNVDDTFVGRLLGPAQLGFYGLAYKLSNLPATQITRLVGQVMFPAFSKLRDDVVAFRRAFFQSMRYVSLLAIPISIGTIVFADDFIKTLYGQKWAPAILPMQLLGIYGLLRSVAANMGHVFQAGGKPKWLTMIALWRLGTMLAFLWPATYYWGIMGVSLLSALVSIVDFGISTFLTNRIIRASYWQYVRTLGPIMLVSLGAAAAGKLVQHSLPSGHDFLNLVMAGMTMVIVYAIATWTTDRELRGFAAYVLGQLGVVQARSMTHEA